MLMRELSTQCDVNVQLTHADGVLARAWPRVVIALAPLGLLWKNGS